jgi:hypothetical protein
VCAYMLSERVSACVLRAQLFWGNSLSFFEFLK